MLSIDRCVHILLAIYWIYDTDREYGKVFLTLNPLPEALLGFPNQKGLIWKTFKGTFWIKGAQCFWEDILSLSCRPADPAAESWLPAAAAATCRLTAVLLLCGSTEVTDSDLQICQQHLHSVSGQVWTTESDLLFFCSQWSLKIRFQCVLSSILLVF